MKTKRKKEEVNKFDLEKFKVAKLKNMHTIKGGNAPGDETIDGTGVKGGDSSGYCK